MKAQWRGHLIAATDSPLELHGYWYFPRSAVRMEWLTAAARTEADLRCPHGVQFFDLADRGHRSERAAWSYESPQPSFARVDHWIGFWNDVELTD
jgi:uncharacterized protein (DUF427 family)